jgi:hypothetical protein
VEGVAVATFFSDYFGVDQNALDDQGALNVSLVNDLPLFIDPFLLFNSEKKDYQDLRDGINHYLVNRQRDRTQSLKPAFAG